jgi:hypothetical protein
MSDLPFAAPSRESLAIPAKRPTRALTWTGHVEWYTPGWLLEAAAAAMGGAIDLDPTSSDAQQAAAAVKAARYFTIVDNGLEQPWCGRVFMNPPYATGWCAVFVSKFLDELRAGNVQEGVLLTNMCSDTEWWHTAASACDALCLLLGRVRFLRLDDGALTTGKARPSFPNSVMYFGPHGDRFAKAFERHGLIFPRPANAGLPLAAKRRRGAGIKP